MTAEEKAAPALRVTPPPDPAESSHGESVARKLRSLAGVNEELLAWAPSERARYTALGGVVLGTATIAAFSMLIGLTEVLGGFHLLLFVPVLIWGVFILNLDRWLVSSSAGLGWQRRATVLLPRLVLAFCFGVVIAEPLVLRIFQPAIERHVQDRWEHEKLGLQSTLLRCNPDPTASAEAQQQALAPECAGHRITLQAGYAATAQELTGRQQEATTLRETVNADKAEQAKRDMLASNECAGTPGPGTTGRSGRGPECFMREREAQEFRASHPTAAREQRLEELNGQISALQTELNGAQQGYQAERTREIDNRVAELAATRTGDNIGLLERLRALDELTDTNVFLAAATWFVRLFFVLIDCLPVIVKFFGGVTRYERLVEFRADASQKVFEQTIRTTEIQLITKLASEQATSEHVAHKRRLESELELRWAEAEMDARFDERVASLAARMQHPIGGDGATADAAYPTDYVNGSERR